MKKKITLLAVIAVVMTTGIFAEPIRTDINSQVLISFTNRFAGAQEVSWNKADQYMKASFVKEGQAMAAYFDVTGQMIGVSRNILSQQLPINLNFELRKLIANGWITELFEFTTAEETAYFVTVETSSQKLHLKSAGSGEWEVYKKSKKS